MLNLTPVQAQWLTLAFVIAVTALVIGYDVMAIRAWGVEASISRVMRRPIATCLLPQVAQLAVICRPRLFWPPW